MAVNLKSALRLSQLAAPHLQRSEGGSIVNVSSVAGLRAYPGALAYKLSKAAMDQMTRCVALEVGITHQSYSIDKDVYYLLSQVASTGVRVNSVNPGVVWTEIWSRSGMSDQETRDYLAQAKVGPDMEQC